MLVRKNTFLSLGGFDKNFVTSFEDVDLGWRAWILGYQVVVIPKSIVYHKGGQTVQDMSSEIRYHGVKNTLILNMTNFESISAINRILKLFFVSFLKKYFAKSDVKNLDQNQPLPSFKLVVRGIFWTFKNWKYISNKRKKVNSMRVRSTEELMKLNLIKDH